MVKMLKHELFALFRVLVFFAAAVIAFACLGRLMIYLETNKNEATLSVMFVMFYVFAIFALIIAAFALGVSRFYKTLFTGEGYMTLSLPVKSTSLIWAKLLSSIIAMAFATVVSVLSLTIFLIGVDPEIIESISWGFSVAFDEIGAAIAAEPLYFFEGLVTFVLSIPMSLLVFYALISLGQLFTAHRKALTFVFFIAFYIAAQMFSLLCFAPIMSAAESVSPHLAIWVLNVFIAAVDVGCFFLIRYILKNKVNLIV